MFNTINMNQLASDQLGKTNVLEPHAVTLFERHLRDGSTMLINKLLGRKLLPILVLDQEVGQEYNNRHYAGAKAVAVQDIHGTVSRSHDFDYNFAPLKSESKFRWCKVATAMLRGVNLPAVELIQVGDNYFVKDGHHRISVAHALGYTYIDAIVEIWS